MPSSKSAVGFQKIFEIDRTLIPALCMLATVSPQNLGGDTVVKVTYGFVCKILPFFDRLHYSGFPNSEFGFP